MSDSTELMGLLAGIAGGIALAAILHALADRKEGWQNRYEVAVAAEQPVTKVASVLEAMVKYGLVQATGDVAQPNHREYQLDQKALAEA
jgi:DNA-binding IclR family transcriptional regulator